MISEKYCKFFTARDDEKPRPITEWKRFVGSIKIKHIE